MGVRSVLAVGAVAGAVEAGCAGTLAAHRAAGDSVTVLVLSGSGGEDSAKALDCLLVHGAKDRSSVTASPDTIATIENVISGIEADVIYAPAPDDARSEHRATAAATLSAARNSSRVLHYTSDTTLRFEPSVFVDVTAYLDTKLALVTDPKVAAASARHLGALARVRYAEAFEPSRFVWDL